MPKDRKPLIAEGTLATSPDAPVNTPSLQERILARDRAQAGRGVGEREDLVDNITSNITAHITANTPDPVRSSQDLAAELANTRLMPITLRLPEGLNDWLDDYTHANRKSGVKKQDLISRAVQLLIIELTERGSENL